MMSELEWKRAAAAEALKYVDDGMALGLGTGSTAAEFVAMVGERVRGGLQIICVPTSEATRKQAEALSIPLTTLDETPTLDLTIDGADEIDRALRLIKGGGGALLREKIVAMASERVVIIADHSKRVDVLGRFPLPIEVVQFGLTSTYQLIEELAADCGCEGEINQRMRDDGSAFVTDNGNFILDCAFGAIEDPESLEDALRMVPGMIESGLFVGVADLGIVAGPEGIEVLALEEQFPGSGRS